MHQPRFSILNRNIEFILFGLNVSVGAEAHERLHLIALQRRDNALR